MKLSEKSEKEIKEFYEMIEDEIYECLKIIEKKTGYYTTGEFLLFEDEPKRCMDIELNISLLEKPHEVDISKMEYYIKVNPDNCLNKRVIAHNHNSWYMIYDGVHRTAANKNMGKKTIKANIIVPKPE